jgi:hypothetical protein
MNLAENGAENYDWNSEGVYQLEVTDRVQGGPGGVANRQAAELANRTRNLHGRVQNVEANKAPLVSPALTGTPTAPTAAVGTNNTQIANTAFVQALVAALVNSSPAALDTLKELATALGNDANFATTMTNALAGKLGVNAKAADSYLFNGQVQSEFFRYLGYVDDEQLDNVVGNGISIVSYAAESSLLLSIDFGGSIGLMQQEYSFNGRFRWRNKTDNYTWSDWREIWHTGNLNPSQMAPLASPAFTGTPTVPTAAVGTNNTQIANTAFVQAALAALVASSPAALDTLNELAAALGNDANFAASVNNALAEKVPLASASNWPTKNILGSVIGMMAWRNYGVNHVIFDASSGVSPSGSSISHISPQQPVDSVYENSTWGVSPNLMGWNGTNTFGVRVDFARLAHELDGKHAADFVLLADFTGSSDLPGSEIDWTGKPVRTKTLTANTTLTFSNLIVNKTITLRITGAYTLILPASVTTISGEYDGSKVNLIQLLCINSAAPEVWCVISQPKA